MRNLRTLLNEAWSEEARAAALAARLAKVDRGDRVSDKIAEKKVFEEMDSKGIRVDTKKLDGFISEVASKLNVAPAADKMKWKRRLSVLQGIKSKTQQGGDLFADKANESRIYPRHVDNPNLGRITPEGFNYTSLPREYRGIVQADSGQQLLEIDGYASELVVLAHMSGDEQLKKDIASGDVYQALADVEKISRQDAKIRIIAGIYADSSWALEKAWPKAAKYMDDTRKQVAKTGTSKSAFGTERQFDLSLESAARSGASHHIQSTSAEVYRKLLAPVNATAHELEGRVIGFVHDAFLISIPKGEKSAQYVDDIKNLMARKAADTGFPITFKAKLYPNGSWGES